MNALDASLVFLSEVFAAHRGVSLWRVGHLAAGRGSFFVDIKNHKRHCQTNTHTRVLQWFSDHWPSDLAWPSDIPPPSPTHDHPKEAA